ncbi:MAG: M12 family metallopeptidase [Phycisphaerales bacterium]|nr:M12 family metallopeptidase [Phycisphaerales bacterium]
MANRIPPQSLLARRHHPFPLRIAGLLLLFPPILANAAEPDGIPAGFRVIEGDIIVPSDLQARGTFASNLWTCGIVPYEFDLNVSVQNRTRAIDAMAVWEAVANVDFIPRNGHSNYVYIRNSTGNSSFVGMIGGGQPVNIASWHSRFIIVHEFGHALGFWHEQSRTDRDQYIRINTDYIQPGREHNFFIHPASSHHGPYDFDSVMHYSQCAFSICCPVGSTCNCASGCETITVLPPNERWQTLIGQRNHISTGDADTLAFLYGTEAIGACCHDDGTCHITTAAECEGTNETYWGDCTDCTPNPCPQPSTGACCHENGACRIATAAECSGDAETYFGDGSNCTPNPCPQPTGACCNDDGTCRITTAAECNGDAETYFGDGSNCTPNPCPQPTGACCDDDGTCRITTAAECIGDAETYFGDGSNCTPNPCPQPPMGACCDDDGTCRITTAAECNGDAETYFGDGSNCTPNPCPQPTGACCHDEGTCRIATPAECNGDAETYSGHDTDCTPNPCPSPPPTGGCCNTFYGTCSVTTQAECEALNRMYLGDDIECAPDTCGVTPAPVFRLSATCLTDSGRIRLDWTGGQHSKEFRIFRCEHSDSTSSCDPISEWQTETVFEDSNPRDGMNWYRIRARNEFSESWGFDSGSSLVSEEKCAASSPVGACCLGGNTCITALTQASCDSQGGIWQGPGSTSCANCPAPLEESQTVPCPVESCVFCGICLCPSMFAIVAWLTGAKLRRRRSRSPNRPRSSSGPSIPTKSPRGAER